MRHYEIIFLITPNESVNVVNIINYYSEIIFSDYGKIHRLENWGLKYLAYNINNLCKAYYILMNVEINCSLVNKLEKSFNMDDKVIRFLIIRRKKIESFSSVMMLNKNDNVVVER